MPFWHGDRPGRPLELGRALGGFVREMRELGHNEASARLQEHYALDERAANNEAVVGNWLLLGADAMAYAHHLSSAADYLEWATRLFRTGSRDPWFEGDANTYSSTKETANSVSWGHLFLHE